MENRQPATNCPNCNKAVDPLRGGAVSIVDGRIVHFCSAGCRESRLRGIDAPKQAKAPQPSPVEGGRAAQLEPGPEEIDGIAEAEPVLVAAAPRGAGIPRRIRRWLRPLLLESGGLLVGLGIVLWVPAEHLAGQLHIGVAAAAVLALLVTGIIDQRNAGASRILEASAVPLAGAALLAAGVIGERTSEAAAWAVVLLLIQRFGRLLETAGRARSGVLDEVLGNAARPEAREWRDNSVTAERIRRVTLVLDWARFPAAAALMAAMWLLLDHPMERSMTAGAIMLVALEPRILRMVTGDAHLKAALAAAGRQVVIRDAHALEQASAANVALFIPHRCLLEPGMKLVDWRLAPGADEARVLAALAAAEADVQGRVADAVRGFLAGRGIEPPPVEEHTVRPLLGVVARTGAGRLVCGSRSLMIEELISTAGHEDWARQIEAGGRRAMFLALDGEVAATFALEEGPLPRVPESMRQLAALGIEPAMITSAEAEPGHALGVRLGIESVRFETPEEQIGRPLEDLAAAGHRVLLVGHGAAFEENFRLAAAAAACGGEGNSMAGIDVGRQGLDELVRVVGAAREAAFQVRLNAVAAVLALMLGLVLAAGWHFQPSVAAAAVLTAVAAAFTTWNGPYPGLARVRRRVLDLWSRLRRLTRIARASSR